jgi:peptidase E
MNKVKADIFLLAGGRENIRKGVDPLLEHILALAAGRRPAIAYIGAASGDDRDFLEFIGAMCKRAGAGQVLLAPMASPTVNLKKTKAVLSECDLVLVSGGDVELGMSYLELSGLIPFLKQLHDAGKVFLGLSAGSIMLAKSWVRWLDAGNDATAETFPCLGLAPLLCDTHA